MKNSNINLFWQAFIFLAIILALIWAFQSSKVEGFEYESEPKLYVEAPKTPPVETRTSASIERLYAVSTRTEEEQELEYEQVIECIAWHESRRNPDAYNRYDPRTASIGYLQFKRSTWEHYNCSGNIWNAEHQKQCMDEMLRSDWGNVYHWSTASKCLR